MSKLYYTYMVECNDKSLYTGYTTDPIRRLNEHNTSSKGSKYVRSRRPVRFVYLHQYTDKSTAMREEYRIKHSLSRRDKLDLIESDENQIHNILKEF